MGGILESMILYMYCTIKVDHVQMYRPTHAQQPHIKSNDEKIILSPTPVVLDFHYGTSHQKW